MRRFIVSAIVSTVIAGFAAAGAGAAPNPSGTGQPRVECGEDNPIEPAGFTDSAGFSNAEDHYAGPGNPSGNLHVSSQYDVACYQLTSHLGS